MKKLIGTMILTLAFSAAALAGNHKKDEAALTQVMADFSAAWTKHDTKAMTAFWTQDGSAINPMGRVANGQAEVEKMLTEEHGTIMKDTAGKFTLGTVSFVKPDVAILDGNALISGMKSPEGKVMDMDHHLTAVMVKKGGKWMIQAARPYIFVPAPGAGDAHGAKHE